MTLEELMRLHDDAANDKSWKSAANKRAAIESALKQVCEDARRYQWARGREVEIRRYSTVGHHASERLDAAIDAAMSEDQQ